jgi:hypothetical protein
VRALEDGTWQVEVELQTDEGTATRTLTAASCAEALTATAVVLAIAVDASWGSSSSEPPPAVAVPSPPPPGPEPESLPAPTSALEPEPEPEPVGPRPQLAAPERSPPRARPSQAARRPLQLSLQARGGLDYGALPSPAGHVAASVGLLGPRWVVQAGASHRIGTEAAASAPLPVGGAFRLTAGQVLAGPRLRWGAVELPMGAGLEVGALWARGTGQVEPITVRRPWAAAMASAAIGWAPLEAFAMHVGVDGVLSLLRPSFTIGDDVEVLTVGPASVRAWLGMTGRFSL